ncbi:MAG: hypothetical protein Q9162_002648 [Coniocarpon cinnabarinum]
MTRTFSSRILSHTIKEDTETLHSSFTSMATRRGKNISNTTRPVINLPIEVDMEIPGVVVSTSPQRADTMLVLLANDGSCRIFDRASNQLLKCDPVAKKMRHPLEAAFAFLPEENTDFLDCAFSPSGCAIVRCEKDKDMKLKSMEKMLSEPDLRTVAGLSMMSASTCFMNVSNEDVLSHSWQLLEHQSSQELLIEFFKAINANLEYVSEESQSRMSSFLISPIMTKALSMLESMDLSRSRRRSIASKTALVLLELRSQGTAVQLVFNSTPDKPEIRLIDWYNKLMCFLIDDVLEIQRKLRNISDPSLAQIQAEATRMNSPVLVILLASCPRMMLRVGCRFWRTVTSSGGKMASQAPFTHQYSWLSLLNTINHASMDLKQFESFLVGLNFYAQEAYDSAGISEADRRNIERDFLVTGVVPDLFEGLAKRLIRHKPTCEVWGLLTMNLLESGGETINNVRSEKRYYQLAFHDIGNVLAAGV